MYSVFSLEWLCKDCSLPNQKVNMIPFPFLNYILLFTQLIISFFIYSFGGGGYPIKYFPQLPSALQNVSQYDFLHGQICHLTYWSISPLETDLLVSSFNLAVFWLEAEMSFWDFFHSCTGGFLHLFPVSISTCLPLSWFTPFGFVEHVLQ